MRVGLLISLIGATLMALALYSSAGEEKKLLFSFEEVSSVGEFEEWAAKYKKKYLHEE